MNGLGSARHGQLDKDILYMRLDGFRGDPEGLSDPLIRQSGGNQLNNGEFAVAHLRNRFLSRGVTSCRAPKGAPMRQKRVNVNNCLPVSGNAGQLAIQLVGQVFERIAGVEKTR